MFYVHSGFPLEIHVYTYTYLLRPYLVYVKCVLITQIRWGFFCIPRYYYSPQILQTHVLLELTPFYNVETVCNSWFFFLPFVSRCRLCDIRNIFASKLPSVNESVITAGLRCSEIYHGLLPEFAVYQRRYLNH